MEGLHQQPAMPISHAYKSRMTLVHRPCKAPSLILSLLENPGLKLHIYLVQLVTLPVPGGFLPVPCWVLAVTHLITGWDHPQHGYKVWLLGSSLLCSIIILLWNSSTLLLLPCKSSYCAQIMLISSLLWVQSVDSNLFAATWRWYHWGTTFERGMWVMGVLKIVDSYENTHYCVGL